MKTGDIQAVQVEKTARHGRKTVVGICGICPGGCGVEVELAEGKIDRVLPLKDHPMGIVCVRGVHSKDVVYSPDRLKHPLIRAGAKGAGEFERTTWDVAFDGIAERLLAIKKKYGPEAVMTYMGRGVFDASLVEPFAPPGVNSFSPKSLIFPFGSPNNAGCGSLCYTSYGFTAAIPTFGVDATNIYADFDNSRLIVVWGANPATDSPPINLRRILEARKKGARVIAIDHRRSEIARLADQWIAVRSGTDGALALGMLNVLFADGLYDRDFTARWVHGAERLREYAARFTPQEVERIASVPRETVIETARAIANARHATLSMYTGLEYSNSGVQSMRAVWSLFAITGNLDVAGGIGFRPYAKSPYRRTDIAPPSHPKPIGYDRYPLFCELTKSAQFMEAPRAILNGDPYPVRALIIAGSSIITSYPNPELWRRCLSALDLLVVIDRFTTADAQYADYVLPATTYYENLGYQKHPGFIQLRQPIIEPIGEARSDYSIFAELVRRLGYGELYPTNEEALVEWVLADLPIGVDELCRHPEGIRWAKPAREYRKYESGLLRADGQPGFPTPTGKVEVWSTIFEKFGYPPLPVYTEPAEGPLANPELARQYPLVMNTGARIQSAFRSQHLNVAGLLKLQPHPHVLINPLDAARRGIADGQPVNVVSPRGSVPFTARVTDDVRPGAVEINVGGGSPIQAEAWRQANANYLTDMDNRDPISGFPVLKALLCDVQKQRAM